jgi:hypothetical protein
MKRILIATLFIFSIFSLFYIYQKDKNQISQINSAPKTNHMSRVSSPVILKAKKVVQRPQNAPRNPAQQSAPMTENKLSTFPRKKLDWVPGNLSLVKGVEASHKKDPLIDPLFKKSGLYFYETSVKRGLEVIYDESKNSYGVFTGEVIVSGPLQTILDSAKKNNWEVVYQHDVLQEVILKFNNLEEASMISSLDNDSTIKWKLDVQFSRAFAK